MAHPVAAIDLGTNSARLLIVATEPYRQIQLTRVITRLGGGFTRERGLSAEAQQRTLEVLEGFARDIQRHGVTRLRAVATSAVRDAVNGAEFCRKVRARTGIVVEVIDGVEEAFLTLKGVQWGLGRQPGDLVVFDIGGGSTEYTLARDGEPLFSRSLPLGVVRLTEGKAGVAEMEEKIVRELTALTEELARAGVLERFCAGQLIGTAGTATTLAAIELKMKEYDYRRVNNFVMSYPQVERIFGKLAPLTPAERLRQVVGLEPGREDLIVSGTLVALNTMRLFGFDTMTASDAGVLEGLLADCR